MMREILVKNKRDFSVVEVENGKEALDFLEKARTQTELPCLIILDINMPILDGKETLSILKKTEAYKTIPVVIFTTSASEVDKLFCKRYGTEMITKPPSYRKLEDTIVRLLDYCPSN